MDKAVRMLGELLFVAQEQLRASILIVRSLKHRKKSYEKKVEKFSCYSCGEKGHLKRYCQKRQQSSYKRARY